MSENTVKLFGVDLLPSEIELDETGRVIIDNKRVSDAIRMAYSMPDTAEGHIVNRCKNGNCEGICKK